jgi:hypothetical protein
VSEPDQLPLLPPAEGVPANVRRAWLALPFRDQRPCAVCGTVALTAGRRRSSQRCLDCHASGRRRVRPAPHPS